MKSNLSDQNKRGWLVVNVNGLGMKASSHFLRNLGNQSFAIIDTHILKYMGVDKPKNEKESGYNAGSRVIFPVVTRASIASCA